MTYWHSLLESVNLTATFDHFSEWLPEIRAKIVKKIAIFIMICFGELKETRSIEPGLEMTNFINWWPNFWFKRSKSRSFSWWSKFTNWKKWNRLSMAFKWPIFKCFGRKNGQFHDDVFLRIERNGIDWAWSQNDQFSKLITKILVKILKKPSFSQ